MPSLRSFIEAHKRTLRTAAIGICTTFALFILMLPAKDEHDPRILFGIAAGFLNPGLILTGWLVSVAAPQGLSPVASTLYDRVFMPSYVVFQWLAIGYFFEWSDRRPKDATLPPAKGASREGSD